MKGKLKRFQGRRGNRRRSHTGQVNGSARKDKNRARRAAALAKMAKELGITVTELKSMQAREHARAAEERKQIAREARRQAMERARLERERWERNRRW